MTISALPIPPSRSDPANFATRGDAFMAALPTFRTEANALQADVNANQATTIAAAASAATYAAQAETASDNAFSATSYKGLWGNLTGALNIPASVSHNGFLWMLLSNATNVTTETPGISSKWKILESIDDALLRFTESLGSAAFADIEQIPKNVWPAIKTSAYTVTPDDNGKTLVVSGATTISLLPASLVFNSHRPFSVTIKAVTGATVTVEKYAGDTIETVAGSKSLTANTALTFFPITTTAWETI